MADLLREAEQARVDRGVSYATMATAMGLSPSYLARLLRGERGGLTIPRLAEVLQILGLELSARAFPAGSPVRDRAQLALLARARSALAPGLRWRHEVPVRSTTADPVDLRAWDAVVNGAGWWAAVDAETRVADVQALQRRTALKQRDGDAPIVIVLLADTRHNREVLAAGHGALIEQFPIRPRVALRRLRAGLSPGGNTLLLL